jgi:hypothetical protein
LESLIERFNTRDQAKFYVEHAGADFADYQLEHDAYEAAVSLIRRDLEGLSAKVHCIERGFVPNYLFTEKDLLVTVGQDGLVVNVAKYLDGQPIVAVNPDPERFDGVLLPFLPGQARVAVQTAFEGRARVRRITMAEAQLGDGQRLLAFNDFFVGARSHVSARYVIEAGGRREVHSSSGVIVATGAGSSGWLSSLYNMARGMAPLVGRAAAELGRSPDSRFDWEADLLRFVVREPFRSKASQADLVFGELRVGESLRLESRMPEEGVIFSDGVEADHLAFNAGAIAQIRIAGRKTRLVVSTDS